MLVATFKLKKKQIWNYIHYYIEILRIKSIKKKKIRYVWYFPFQQFLSFTSILTSGLELC